jgi:hypothetical protein
MATPEELNKNRGGVYGPFLNNAIVAQAIKQALRHPCTKVTLPDDVREALDLIALKMSRIVTGDPEYLDNWDDIGGYVRCVSERIRATQLRTAPPKLTEAVYPTLGSLDQTAENRSPK